MTESRHEQGGEQSSATSHQQVQGAQRTGTMEPPGVSGWIGWVIFAGFTMLIVGGFQAVMGLVGIFNTDFYVTTENLAIPVNYTLWGWTHLIMGLIVAFAGVAVMTGKTWGRVVGIVLAALQAIVAFAWFPAYPFWSLIVIAVDVLVIYALAVHGGEMRALGWGGGR